MRRIDILLTSELPGGCHPFVHDDLSVHFHLWSGSGAPPLMSGRAFAFIDWNLAGISGIEMCRRLRCNPDCAGMHIVVLLDNDHPDDRRKAVRAGANECIVGPLNRTALLDRIMALRVEQAAIPAAGAIVFGDLVVDTVAFIARWRGTVLAIMPNEFRLLRFLVQHPGRVFTRSQLIEALGKQEPGIDERTVDVWIGRLRRAMKQQGAASPLRTVRGMGYVLDLPDHD